MFNSLTALLKVFELNHQRESSITDNLVFPNNSTVLSLIKVFHKIMLIVFRRKVNTEKNGTLGWTFLRCHYIIMLCNKIYNFYNTYGGFLVSKPRFYKTLWPFILNSI